MSLNAVAFYNKDEKMFLKIVFSNLDFKHI